MYLLIDSVWKTARLINALLFADNLLQIVRDALSASSFICRIWIASCINWQLAYKECNKDNLCKFTLTFYYLYMTLYLYFCYVHFGLCQLCMLVTHEHQGAAVAVWAPHGSAAWTLQGVSNVIVTNLYNLEWLQQITAVRESSESGGRLNIYRNIKKDLLRAIYIM